MPHGVLPLITVLPQSTMQNTPSNTPESNSPRQSQPRQQHRHPPEDDGEADQAGAHDPEVVLGMVPEAIQIDFSEEWSNFLDVLEAQKLLPIFDEDSQQIQNLSYTDLLDFTHMSTPTIQALSRSQRSDSSNDTLPYSEQDTEAAAEKEQINNELLERAVEGGLPDVILMNPYIHSRSQRTIPI